MRVHFERVSSMSCSCRARDFWSSVKKLPRFTRDALLRPLHSLNALQTSSSPHACLLHYCSFVRSLSSSCVLSSPHTCPRFFFAFLHSFHRLLVCVRPLAVLFLTLEACATCVRSAEFLHLFNKEFPTRVVCAEGYLTKNACSRSNSPPSTTRTSYSDTNNFLLCAFASE